MTQRWLTLGRVSGAFGVKGWVKVRSYTEPLDNLGKLGVWTLRRAGADRVFEVESARLQGTAVVAKLRGIDERDGALEWVGADVVVERGQLPPAGNGEIYWADLEGCEVRTLEGVVLGRVDHLLATGANDVLVVRGEVERLVPFVMGRVVQSVDLAAGVIVVDWSPDY